jgi:hypothetical protein
LSFADPKPFIFAAGAAHAQPKQGLACHGPFKLNNGVHWMVSTAHFYR